MYEKQADQTDLSQINKANACMEFSQINSKVTDVKGRWELLPLLLTQ